MTDEPFFDMRLLFNGLVLILLLLMDSTVEAGFFDFRAFDGYLVGLKMF